MTLSILGQLFFARDWLFGITAASPAPVADLETMVLPTCLRGTRATHHATHGALCPPVLISKCSGQFHITQREGENTKGEGKKRKSETEKNVRCLGFVFPLPLSTTPSILLQQCPRTPNEITAAKSRVARAENGGEGVRLSSGVRLPKMSECFARGHPRVLLTAVRGCRPPLGIAPTPTERSHSSDSATAVLLRQAPLREEARSTSARLVPLLPSWSAATAAHEMAPADRVVSSACLPSAEARGKRRGP